MDIRTDPVTRIFGAFGAATADRLDWSTGALRDVPQLDQMWGSLDLSHVLDDIGRYPGTQGTPDLLDALAMLTESEWGFRVPAERIVAVHGSFDGISHALAGLPRNSAVLFPTPGFDVRLPIIRAGCVPVPVPWEIGTGVRDFLVDADRAVRRTRARAMLVNLPRNPDGTAATAGEWEELLELGRTSGIRVVLDDVYGFTDESRPRALFEGCEAVVVDSLSKRMGAPGLRAGFILCPAELMPAIRGSAACTVGLARPVAHIVARATRQWLAGGVDEAVRGELRRRAAALWHQLPPRLRDRLLLRPGSLYAALRVEDDDRAARVLGTAGLRVTPSRALDLGESRGTPFIRLCLGASAQVGPAARILTAAEPELRGHHRPRPAHV